MMFEHDDYSVTCAPGDPTAVLRGVMRLPTPAAYERIFMPLAARVSSGSALSVDLTQVTFMNSSGIRALATLVLSAKAHGTPLRIIASRHVPWQNKTAASLGSLSPALDVDLR